MSFKQKFRPIQLDPRRVAQAEAQGAKVSAADAAALAEADVPGAADAPAAAAATMARGARALAPAEFGTSQTGAAPLVQDAPARSAADAAVPGVDPFGTSQAAAATLAPQALAPLAPDAAAPAAQAFGTSPTAANPVHPSAAVAAQAAAQAALPEAAAGATPAVAPTAAPAAAGTARTAGPEFGTSQTGAVPGWQVGAVYDVPQEYIRPNPVNPRIFYTDEAIEQMVESLAAEGQATAATGYVEDGYVVLIEGHTRQKASLKLGWTTLRVEIRPKPEDLRSLYETARAANDARTNPSNLDEALRWRQLLDGGVYPHQRALAASLRVSEADVSRVLSLARMPQSILQALAEVPALLPARTLASVRAYWESCGDDKTLALVAQARSRGMGFREIDALRKLAEKGPTKRPHASRQKVAFGGGKGELKTFEDGRIQLLLEGLSADEARELQQRIQKALKA